MMQDLGWEQLQTRCQQNKTVMMYRIVNNLVEIPADQNETVLQRMNVPKQDTIVCEQANWRLDIQYH